jgi:ABC-type Mn2+/Zn2+ transport system ATPase subunit
LVPFSERPLLSVEGLTFGYRKQQSRICDVSFTVSPGEILGLLGPNGAGKATLISLIAGMLRPRQGRVQIDGKPARLVRIWLWCPRNTLFTQG